MTDPRPSPGPERRPQQAAAPRPRRAAGAEPPRPRRAVVIPDDAGPAGARDTGAPQHVSNGEAGPGAAGPPAVRREAAAADETSSPVTTSEKKTTARPELSVQGAQEVRVEHDEKPARQLPPIMPMVRGVVGRLGDIVQLVFAVLAIIVVLGAVLVAIKANLSNGIVAWFVHRSFGLVGPFKDIFTSTGTPIISTTGDPLAPGVAGYSKAAVLENWAVAAVVYLAIGAVARRILQRLT
ncbi:MAG: hypothetical protein JWM48_138 [Mycobacterium sp.]|nr:hypothetical protein [Mycobacterium sp.]